MSNIQVWREGTSGEPKFSKDFKVTKKAVLQVTDIKTNRNKYYAVELHTTKDKYRVYTHYGRTDDLDSNPEAGVRESRYCDSLQEAEKIYEKIFSEKTSSRKGYKEINLASSKIGSKKTIGKSSGTIDDKTLSKLKDQPTVKTVCTLSKSLQDFVSYIYAEATNTLVKTVNVNITANGIETPLGVLTLAQIDKGQEYLDQLANLLGKKKTKAVQDDIIQVTGEFYTVVPHKFGRSKEAAQEAVINSVDKLTARQDTLQLMKDMLNVNSKGNVLVNPAIEQKYNALDCKIEVLDKNGVEFKKIASFVMKSKSNGRSGKIKNIYTLRRESEHTAFAKDIGNDKLLFHGSNIQNWVGILSRGILLPKVVVKLGVHRTDSGWLGHGIYFGDAMDTSLAYADSGSKGTSLVAVATVALGKMKDYSKITHGLVAPPSGFDSCHGVRGTEFYDDEYVIYAHNQQKLEYLVEI